MVDIIQGLRDIRQFLCLAGSGKVGKIGIRENAQIPALNFIHVSTVFDVNTDLNVFGGNQTRHHIHLSGPR